MEGKLERAEACEEGRLGPGDIDADEREGGERGEGAIKDNDRRRTNGVEQPFRCAPVLDMPELEMFKVRCRSAGGEDGACASLADKVADFERERAPARDVGNDDIEHGLELITE